MSIHQETDTRCGRVLAILLILVACRAAWAQTVTTIHAFQGSPGDGQQPGGVVAGPGGVLYGFAGGGASNDGMVFSLTPPSSSGGAWSETVLYNFKGQPGDGSGPLSLVTGTDSHGRFVLYGLTSRGGTQEGGTAFMLMPPASAAAPWSEAIMYDFPKLPGYTHPFPLLLNGGLAVGAGADGRPVLYGTTFEGGSGTCRFPSLGCGTVYSLTPGNRGERWTQTTLYNFNGSGVDGFFPDAGVVIGAGPHGRLTLFGTTGAGGVGGGGTVFALNAPEAAGGAWTETILTNFRWGGPSLATTPKAAVTIGRGTNGHPLLYGTALQGGHYGCPNVEAVGGCGAVFALAPPASAGGAWTRGELYDFYPTCCGDAYWPSTALVVASGSNGQPVLYGTSYQGGSSNLGAIYSVVAPASGSGAWTETVVHSFTGVPPDGSLTGGMVMGSGGILYGVTAEGGTPNNYGTVFSLQP